MVKRSGEWMGYMHEKFRVSLGISCWRVWIAVWLRRGNYFSSSTVFKGFGFEEDGIGSLRGKAQGGSEKKRRNSERHAVIRNTSCLTKSDMDLRENAIGDLSVKFFYSADHGSYREK